MHVSGEILHSVKKGELYERENKFEVILFSVKLGLNIKSDPVRQAPESVLSNVFMTAWISISSTNEKIKVSDWLPLSSNTVPEALLDIRLFPNLARAFSLPLSLPISFCPSLSISHSLNIFSVSLFLSFLLPYFLPLRSLFLPFHLLFLLHNRILFLAISAYIPIFISFLDQQRWQPLAALHQRFAIVKISVAFSKRLLFHF